jgi:hypothetical protein
VAAMDGVESMGAFWGKRGDGLESFGSSARGVVLKESSDCLLHGVYGPNPEGDLSIWSVWVQSRDRFILFFRNIV